MTSPTYLLRLDDASILRFDVVSEISLSPTVRVTEHPIEDGSAVVDHAQLQPMTGTLKAVISESPYSGSPIGVRRVQEALDWLDDSVGRFIRIVNRVRTIDNVLLTRWPTKITKIRNLPLSISFKQVTIASATSVTIEVSDVTRSDDGSDGSTGDAALDELTATDLPGEVDAAEQATTDTSGDVDQEGENTSTLYDLLNSFGEV